MRLTSDDVDAFQNERGYQFFSSGSGIILRLSELKLSERPGVFFDVSEDGSLENADGLDGGS
jgi:hypothetical protein